MVYHHEKNRAESLGKENRGEKWKLRKCFACNKDNKCHFAVAAGDEEEAEVDEGVVLEVEVVAEGDLEAEGVEAVVDDSKTLARQKPSSVTFHTFLVYLAYLKQQEIFRTRLLYSPVRRAISL